MSRPPLPPFTCESAIQKIRGAEDAWNSRDPERCAAAYTEDSRWRNRSTFLQGRDEIIAFLTAKWEREHGYRLIKELWAFGDDRIWRVIWCARASRCTGCHRFRRRGTSD